MLYSCSSLWLFLPCTCSHLLVNRLLLLGTIGFQSSALDRNGAAEGTVRHLPFGRLAASHAVGAFEHVCSFDTVDHAILLQRLESSFGVSGGVLSWLSSFLDGRTQRVHLLDSTSSVKLVRSGVPQGSILGPLLFLPYTADIPLIDSDFGLNVHCYADDGQINK